MSVRPYPYVLFYKVSAELDEVRILRVRHTARRA
jgi:plasmid stabilization system protein ParE